MEDIQYLLDITSAHEVNTVQTVYLQNLVEIGHVGDKPILCNAVDGSFHSDKLSAHILYDKVPDTLYGSSYNFSYVPIHQGDYIMPEMVDIVLHKDWVERIVLEIKNDYGFLIEQLDIRKINMELACRIHQNKTHKKIFTWDERLSFAKCKAYIDHLLNRHDINFEQEQYDRMICMGEEAWNKEQQAMIELLNDL